VTCTRGARSESGELAAQSQIEKREKTTMSLAKAKELRESRQKIALQMAELLKEGTLSVEKRASFDKMDVEQAEIKADIDRIERQEALESELRSKKQMENEQPGANGGEKRDARSRKEKDEEYRKTFFGALQRGELRRANNKAETLSWSGDRDSKVKESMDRYINDLNVEQRDQIGGTQSISYTQGAAGGYFVPAGFVYDVEIATKYFCPMADGSVIRVLETATGNVLPYPTNNDTNEAWSIIGEAVAVLDVGQVPNYSTAGTAPSGQPGNATMGQITFGAWKGTTGLIRVSLEILQDAAFDLEDFLKNAFAVRLGRGYEYYLTRGSGSNQPTGILTAVVASGQAATVANGSSTNDGTSANGTNSIGTNDLIALEHSIDPTYRRGGKFMFHDDTLRAIKQLLDKYGRPLWVPGLAVNAPDTIMGYPYVVNQSMPKIATSANTVLFGSLNKFMMRKVRDLSVLRLDERYADYGEVAFIAFSRIDSNLLDAGVHPIGFLQQHS